MRLPGRARELLIPKTIPARPNLKVRQVFPEILDTLDPADPLAVGSRQDLRRINAIMGHTGIVAETVRSSGANRILEIGAGDGAFFARVAHQLNHDYPPADAVLLDLQERPSSGVQDEFYKIGWNLESVRADVFDYLADPATETADLIIANLFLHHFQEGDLARLLALIAAKSKRFIACEPRRSGLALRATSFLGLIGCNEVTRHDGKVSVMAGFVDGEVSRLWPDTQHWRLEERRLRTFSHLFRADRVG